MIYQFICWRLGLFKRMYVVNVEKLFDRLRKENNGKLPLFIRRWEQRVIFAGEAGIMLPENRAVAEQMTANEEFPNLSWLDERYTEVLKHVEAHQKDLLEDPPVPKTPPKIEGLDAPPPSPPEPPKTFGTIVEGSVSNTAGRDGDTCSGSSPATLTPTSTSGGLPNSSLTGQNPSPRTPRR